MVWDESPIIGVMEIDAMHLWMNYSITQWIYTNSMAFEISNLRKNPFIQGCRLKNLISS